MRAHEFINKTTEELILEVVSSFVNKQVDRSYWKPPGERKSPPKGQTASVWQSMTEPDKVVKIVGGGKIPNIAERHINAAIAFVDFLVHHGKKSPHLPIVHDINLDDPSVVQIKMEALFPIESKDLRSALAGIAWKSTDAHIRRELKTQLQKTKMSDKNSVDSIAKCVDLLNKHRPFYTKKYNLKILVNDLHADNWMMTNDGVIVAVDPWFAGWGK